MPQAGTAGYALTTRRQSFSHSRALRKQGLLPCISLACPQSPLSFRPHRDPLAYSRNIRNLEAHHWVRRHSLDHQVHFPLVLSKLVLFSHLDHAHDRVPPRPVKVL